MKRLFVSLLLWTMVIQVTGVSVSDWNVFKDHSYFFDTSVKTWSAAEIACRGKKAQLASIHNFEEHRFIQELIKRLATPQVTTWIGGTDCQEDKVFLWSDGTPLDYLYWHTGYPLSGACIALHKDNELLWVDLPCIETYAYVCKKAHP